jgi:hypothetical protein
MLSSEVQAFSEAPASSVSMLIARASRRAVPLKTMCSTKWARPDCPAGSSRLPAARWIDSAAHSESGSVATASRKPPGRVTVW